MALARAALHLLVARPPKTLFARCPDGTALSRNNEALHLSIAAQQHQHANSVVAEVISPELVAAPGKFPYGENFP